MEMSLALVLFFVANIYTAVSQRSCTTPNGEAASCIPLQSCKVFYDYIESPKKDPEINKYLVASKCGSDARGYPLVCCGSDLLFKSTLPNRTQCGYQETFRIIGGDKTQLNEFPWLALLQQITSTGVRKWGCGGSLINNRYVLTAAHCVSNPASKVISVRLGEWDLNTEQDCIGMGTARTCSKPHQDIGVETTIPHPEYSRSQQGIFNDIGLIRLAAAAVYNERSCTTPNGEAAGCIPLRSCKLFYDYIESPKNDPEINKYLFESKCGRDTKGQHLVCCGSDLVFKSTLPSRSQCGFQENYRIIGGNKTDLTEFPWLALLERTKRTGETRWDCGGSLINSRYVLTAAHCVSNPASKVTLVRLGEWDLRTDPDCIGKGAARTCSKPHQDFGVEKTILHPEYSRTRQGVFNDIGLIRLTGAAVYNDFVQPICLPLPGEKTPIGGRPYVAGWGAVSVKQNHSEVKLKLKVPVVELQICADKFGEHGFKVNEKMVCAGGEKGKDSCKGDSGGPLMSTSSSDSSQYYVEGVVSYGLVACGTEGTPAIYTRVADFLDWIQQNVKP